MIKKIVFVVFVSMVIGACSKDEGSSSSSDSFNRTTLLTNMADNIIIPAHQDLDTKLTDLVTKKDAFIASPNQNSLNNFRTSWLNAYKIWQYVEMFNIGKAEEILYVYQMNVYPTNTTDIENNILSGNYDLSHTNNNDAVGFPALDYMLYGLATTDNDILEKYTTNTNAVKYKNYLSDLVNQMKTLNETVTNDWVNSYRNTFINSSDNTVSSALNKLVNDFIYYYEKGLRANKIGIPAGVFSNTSLPNKVEGFYSKEYSKTLAIEAIKAVQATFNGVKYNSTETGVSYNAYLQHLGKSDLTTSINEKLDNSKTQVALLNDSFYTQVTTDNTKMTQAYDALQQVVVLFKVDMLQAFNVSVDYVDADGD